jgi:hypothetical protein
MRELACQGRRRVTPMGFFSLKQKFKKREAGDERKQTKTNLKIDTSPRTVHAPTVPSTLPSSPETFRPSNPLCNNAINPPLTPPPTPIINPHSATPPLELQSMRPRSASAPERLPSKGHLKPERSTSLFSMAFSKSTKTSPQQQQRSKSLSSSLFQTRGQRKRREKREGKLPAILPDYETPEASDSEPTNSSYTSFNSRVETEGICDPSSSTTYSPNQGSTTGKSPGRQSRRAAKDGTTSLRLTMLQMTL